jgi:hypothetical protein
MKLVLVAQLIGHLDGGEHLGELIFGAEECVCLGQGKQVVKDPLALDGHGQHLRPVALLDLLVLLTEGPNSRREPIGLILQVGQLHVQAVLLLLQLLNPPDPVRKLLVQPLHFGPRLLVLIL